ncbi:MAG: GGDEF domain-containing protein [Halioglobus sp.]|nr:GGDEF domain-containing protein [Halioglobus sp.]
MATDNQQAQPPQLMTDPGLYYSGLQPSNRLGSLLSVSYDPADESGDDHKDRLFLQVLLSLAVNILALAAVFYILLPLSDSGREKGGLLLWTVLGITAVITAVFLKFGRRVICVNLLLLMLGGVLSGASFFLGGVLSPTMIFLLALPVLAATLLHSRWAFFWTAVTIAAWLLILVLEYSGVEMTRVTRTENLGIVQVISLLGTVLVIMAVLGSYVAANARLRVAMQEKNDRLNYLASHDSLTSIPNRRTFFEQAQHCLQRSKRSKNPFALLVIDLNNFKQINDQLGHKAGDAVLLHLGNRLRAGFRDTDFIGRLGGDEFGVLLEPADTEHGVGEVMQRFNAIGAGEFEVDGQSVSYHFAVGTALYPRDGATVLQLYEAADAAMYQSKKGVPSAFIWK